MRVLFFVPEKNKGFAYLNSALASRKDVILQAIIVKSEKKQSGKFRRKIKSNISLTLQFVHNFIISLYCKKISSKILVSSLNPFVSVQKQYVEDVNSDKVHKLVDNFGPDIIVISGTRRISDSILNKAKLKINLHHGLVPMYRGVSSSSWVVYERDFGSFAVTVHEPIAELDKGMVLTCERIVPHRGESLFFFKLRIIWEGYSLLLDCIDKLLLGEEQWFEQDNINARNLMHKHKPEDFLTTQSLNEAAYDTFTQVNGKRNFFWEARSRYKSKQQDKNLQKGLYILNYHDICTEHEAKEYKKLNYPSIYTTLNNWEDHLTFMQNNGEVMCLSEALQLWRCGEIGERTIFVVTIDDGLKSSQFIVNKLHEFGVNPTLFLNANPILNAGSTLHNHPHLQPNLDRGDLIDKYYSVDDIRKLLTDSQHGIELGSHTFNHINLSDIKFKEAYYEIVECHSELENHVGVQIPYFAFPYGKLNARNYLSDSVARSLNATIFECYGGINKTYRDHYNLLRIGIHNETTNGFAELLGRQWIR